jgi:peptidyl-prolyl cis-trans isomerase A (cyclophilin A)
MKLNMRVLFIASLAIILFSSTGYADETTEPGDSAEPSVRVALETERGTILVEVYPQAAPLSAGDFLRHVDEGLYDNAGFYRVVRPDNDHGTPVISVVQGGSLDEEATPAGITHETTAATGLRHVDGTVSIARGPPGTGSAAAFFIVLGDQPSLDFGGTRNPDKQGFAAFGKVVEGMDVVRDINAMQADAATDDDYVRGQILAEPVRFRARRVK